VASGGGGGGVSNYKNNENKFRVFYEREKNIKNGGNEELLSKIMKRIRWRMLRCPHQDTFFFKS